MVGGAATWDEMTNFSAAWDETNFSGNVGREAGRGPSAGA